MEFYVIKTDTYEDGVYTHSGARYFRCYRNALTYIYKLQNEQYDEIVQMIKKDAQSNLQLTENGYLTLEINWTDRRWGTQIKEIVSIDIKRFDDDESEENESEDDEWED